MFSGTTGPASSTGLIGEVRPFAGSGGLLESVKEKGVHLVLASSGQPRHVRTFLDHFGGRSLADAWTTSDDVEESKPAADLLAVALAMVGGHRGVTADGLLDRLGR